MNAVSCRDEMTAGGNHGSSLLLLFSLLPTAGASKNSSPSAFSSLFSPSFLRSDHSRSFPPFSLSLSLSSVLPGRPYSPPIFISSGKPSRDRCFDSTGMQDLSLSLSRCRQACEQICTRLSTCPPVLTFLLEMSDPWSLSITTSDPRQRGQTHGRPSHLSVGSLVTNASGLAESTISQGTSWTAESADTAVRISQFPAPPTELPTPTTPTRSAFHSPRSAATSLRKSLSSSLTISSHLPSPISPSSQMDPLYRFRVSPVPSHASSGSMASGTASVGQATAYEQTAPLKLHKRNAYASYTPTGSPVSPDKGQSNVLLVPPPIREEPSVPHTPKRPPSPSTLAGSSMYDWTDGMSGISMNTGEERLLSTSFITSLLAQTPDPFAPVQPPTAWNRHERNQYASPDGPYTEQSGQSQFVHNDLGGSRSRNPLTNQSLPQSILSSEFHVNSVQDRISSDPSSHALHQRKLENASIMTGSIRTSGEYSETLHSEEQVQSLVRSPSVLAQSKVTRAIGIAPAYRMSYAAAESRGLPDSAGNSIMTATSTIAPLPPVHRADVPVSVMGLHKFYDAENIPRESEEDFGRKMGSMSLDMEGYELGQSLDLPNSPALPSTAGTETRFTDAQTDSRRQSRRQLSRNQSMRSVVSSLVSKISNTSSARRTKYMAWLKKRPLPPLPSMPRTMPVDPHKAEIQEFEEHIPLPTLAKRAVALGEILDEGELSGRVHHRPKSQFYKELRTDNVVRESHLPVRHDDFEDANRSAESDSKKEQTEHKRRRTWFNGGGDGFTTTSPSRPVLSPFNRSRRFRVIVVACLVFGLVLAIAVPVGVTRHKGSSSTPLPSCPGNSTGAACDLDATCVCTATTGTACKPLAKSLVNLIPTVNSFFTANFTGSSLSDALFNAQGAPQGSTCARQAMLVDVAPGLQQSQFTNRTQWAQSVVRTI